MSSKRNKLLIFLGLITVVASKSHNQRFHSDFEPTRASARNSSAKLHPIDDIETDNQSMASSLQSQIPIPENGDDSHQTEDSTAIITEDYDVSTESEEEAQATQVQLHKTRGSSRKDTSDISDDTSTGKIYFEAQKIKGNKNTRDNRSEKILSRRAGILIADTDVPDSTTKTSTETEAIALKNNSKNEKDNKSSIENEQTPNDGKIEVKKNKKRKKVLRVRPRNPKDDTTSRNSNKHVPKPTEKTKAVYGTQERLKPKVKTPKNVYTPESEAHKKDSGIKLRFPGASRKKELPKPNINSNAVNKEMTEPTPTQENKPVMDNNEHETTSKYPDHVMHDGDSQSNSKPKTKKKKKKKTSEFRSVKTNKASTNQNSQGTNTRSLESAVQGDAFQSNRDFEAARKKKISGRSNSRYRLPKEKQTSVPAANQNYSEAKHKYPQLATERETSEPNKNFNAFINQKVEENKSKSIKELDINHKDSHSKAIFPNVPVHNQEFQSIRNMDADLKETVSKSEEKTSRAPEKQNFPENKFQQPDTIVQNQGFQMNEKFTDYMGKAPVEVKPTRNTNPKIHQKASEKNFELPETPIQTHISETNQNFHDLTKNIPVQSYTIKGNESENKTVHSFFHTNTNFDISKEKIHTEPKATTGFPLNVNQDNSRIQPKMQNYPLQEEVFKSNPNANKKEQSFTEQKATNVHEPKSKEQRMTFFRRTGQKTAVMNNAQISYPESDWNSKFKAENQNEDDNSYVVSFNYMGNKKDDFLRVPPVSTTQTRTENMHEHKSPVKLKNPFDASNLEQTSGILMEEPKQNSRTLSSRKNQDEHFNPNESSDSLNDDSVSFSGEIDGSGEFLLDAKNVQEKPYSPSVTLKRKKIKNSKEPVWKLQTKKKKNPENEWKQTKLGSIHENPTKFETFSPTKFETFSPAKLKTVNPMKFETVNPTNFDTINPTKFDNVNPAKFDTVNPAKFETVSPTKFDTVNPIKFETVFENQKKSITGGSDYYVRSFMNFPSGENVNINIKKEFPYENLKKKVVPRKPLLPLENKGSGNYFMHMYQTMGSSENADIKSRENPGNMGYLSSLKLSWTDDDRNARVEESVDSRAYLATKEYSLSAERFRARDDARRDTMSYQPSENIMQYRPHYVDDFTAPLKNDQPYYFQDIPIMHRRKRSSDNVTQVATHFKIGDVTVENKYTLENEPIMKTLDTMKESTVINKPMPTPEPVLPQSRNVDTLQNAPNAPRQHYIKSYYFKPSESRHVALNVSDIFSRYAKPSRDQPNFHIFQSYQTPNRYPHPHQAHDMTYLFHEKDRRPEIQIPDGINSRSMHSPESRSNVSTAVLKNFKSTLDRKKVESTDVQASYIKPENALGSKSLNETGTNSQTSEKKISKEKAYVPIIKVRTDINTTNSAFRTPWTTAISPSRLNPDGSVSQTEINYEAHKAASAPKSGNYEKINFQPKIDKASSTSVSSIPQRDTIQTEVKAVRLFKKADDTQSKMQSQKPPDVHARRIDDDKSWLHPTQHEGNEYRDYEEETVRHFNENLHAKNQVKNRHRDVQPLTQNDYDQNLNTITSLAPFQWKDKLSSDLSSEKKYPTYHSIPKTHFKCKGQAPGYYADPETECQVFHMCHGNGVKHSFLCPNGTIFHQRLLVCDWYTKVHCEAAESFYGVNNKLYKYSYPVKKDYEGQARRNHQQNQDIAPNHLQPRSKNRDQKEQPVHISTSGSLGATHVPQFVSTQFREDIHKSEFGKQLNNPVSYAPQPKRTTIPTFTDQGSYHTNVRDDRRIYPLSRGENISPNTQPDNLKDIQYKNKGENPGNEVKRERITDPIRNPPYQNNQRKYPSLHHRNSQNTEPVRNKKVIIPLVNAGNSYYVPKLDELRYIDDNAYVAGRQNGKVIIINKYKLDPDYDSAESQESKNSEAPEFHESPTKATLPVPTATVTHAPYNNAKQNLQKIKLEPLITIQEQTFNQNENNDKRNQINSMKEASKYFYKNNNPETNQKLNPVNTRTPQYIYPLPGINQNKDGSREYNFGYRVEDPKAINLQKAQILKLTSQPLKSEPRLNADAGHPTDPHKEKIKWRIAEIKSGVESLGAQVGKILSGTDGTFKNVRIFKMKPGSSSGELEEISLKPFKSQRQSPNTQNLNLKEQKERSHDIDQTELRLPKSNDLEFQSIKQRKPINKQKNLETLPSFKMKSNENGTAKYSHNNHKQTWKATPKYPQKVDRNVVTVQKPNKLDYNKNVELRSFDQVIKTVTPNNIKNYPVQNYPESSHENFKPISQENIPKPRHLIDHNIDQSYVPISTKSSSEETGGRGYELEHVPLEKHDTVKQKFSYENNMKSLPLYQYEKSEHFENTNIPKKFHEMDSSDIIYPDKIILHRPKKVYMKTKPNSSQNIKLVNKAENQNTKYSTENNYKNDLVNSDSLNEKFPTTLHDYNVKILHTTAIPNIDKERRTFVVLSKPTTMARHSSNPKNEEANNDQQDSIETSRSRYVTNLTHISNKVPNKETDCDDSVSSNSHDTVAMELGKNGPTHDSLPDGSKKGSFNEPTSADSGSYNSLSDESVSKCHDKDNSAPNQDNKNSGSEEIPTAQITKPILYNKPTSKAIFKELKRPKYSYTPDINLNAKAADESVQLKSKPVKLFQLQRNMRPAFVKPATAIPMTAALLKSRGYYHPQEMVTNMKHQGHYNEKRELRPHGHNQDRLMSVLIKGHGEKPHGYIQGKEQMGSTGYHQERRQRKPTIYSHQMRPVKMRPVKHYKRGGKEPAVHYERGKKPAGHYERGKEPVGHYERGKEPVGHYERGKEPVRHYERENEPIGHYEREKEPVRHYEREKEPVRHYEREKEPVRNYEREKEPVRHYEREKEPVRHYERGKEPVRHYEREKEPVGHYERGKELKPVKKQGTKPMRPPRDYQGEVVNKNTKNAGEIPPGYIQDKEQVGPADIQNHKSITVSSNSHHNKDSKYAELEKAAELLAMQKLQKSKQNSQTHTYPPVRTEPQGQISTPSSDISYEQQNNHTRHSRYAALEKQAELMAQRMFQSKSQTT